MGKNQTSQIPNILLSVKDASIAISVSTKMVRLLIASGRLKAVNLGKRMTRISLQELTDFAQGQGCNVVLPSSSLPFNNDKRERNKKNADAKPETGCINKTAKCRMTPASEKAPEGVTHKTHYTMAEVMSKFNIKYGRLYEIRNRYQLASVHAWGTTAFRKKDVEKACLCMHIRHVDNQFKSLIVKAVCLDRDCFQAMDVLGCGVILHIHQVLGTDIFKEGYEVASSDVDALWLVPTLIGKPLFPSRNLIS